ncbi:hypothetical protein [Bradyrhizobium sp. CB1015]|uniref:hypothetical protein n=1 Tax=Bradyrhizobium sp. CB1015 TaxID=2976822 RepID=UPI0021AA308D|nr:hypothetical protein [Bradyrhizobium sp. CB1015]UWU89774.1 hypothetical protein N2604_25165 [Bradyrhizobium sp. CB1015]
MYFDEYNYAYYYALKNHSRGAVVKSLNEKVKQFGNRLMWDRVTLSSINRDATDYARTEWPKHYNDTTHHGFPISWERLYFKFLNKPSYFDLAVWQDVEGTRVLQGLALGKPSNAKTHLVIHWVERSFAPNYLKGGILLPILACAEEYAKLLGSERVLIKDAVEPAKYERYGYKPYKLAKVRSSYLAKEL